MQKKCINPVLTLSGLGELCPHLLDPLEDHVAVAVEGLHPPEQLLVVPAVDQDLRQRTLRNVKQLHNLIKYSCKSDSQFSVKFTPRIVELK